MPQNNTNNRSEEVQDILTKTPNSLLFLGNSIILGLLILFFVFTWFIKYPDVISTESIITSNHPPEKIYAQTNGIIDTVLVKDNQLVKPGQVLMVIKNTATFRDVLLLKSVIDTLEFNNTTINLPEVTLNNLRLGSISATFAQFQNDVLEYNLNMSLDPFSNMIRASELSEHELLLRLSSLKNQKALDESKLALSKREFERFKTLFEKGVISLNEFEQKKIAFLEIKKNLQLLDINISQLNQALNEALKNTKDTQITHKIEGSRLNKNLLQSFNLLQEAISSWELKYLIRSNTNGQVSFLTNGNSVQQVQAGDLICTVISNKSNQYLAKIKAPVHNSGKIKNGQEVLIQLYNYPEEEYGMLAAKIESMSAIPNEEGFYLINASLDKALVTSYQIEIPFKNEMTGKAQIITEDLRLIERFFYQLRGIF